jgi:hypothetical protein
MELSIPADKIDIRNIYFMEKKKNVIVDGEFIKILYSTSEFEMNGLFIFAEFTTNQMNIGPPPGFMNESNIEDFDYLNSQNNGAFSFKRCKMGATLNTLQQKKHILFNPNCVENSRLIHLLCKIESDIIDRYIKQNCPSKIASYILKNQLMNGFIKYNSENKYVRSNSFSRSLSLQNRCVAGSVVSPPLRLEDPFTSLCPTLVSSLLRNRPDATTVPYRQIEYLSSLYYNTTTSQPPNLNRFVVPNNSNTYFIQNQFNYLLDPENHSYGTELAKTHLPGYLDYSVANRNYKKKENVGHLKADYTKQKMILKISGVWETSTNVGITMKFILLN